MLFLKTLVALAATLLIGALAAPTADTAPVNLKIRNIEARDVLEDSYIVVFKSNISNAELDTAVIHANGIFTKRGAIGTKHKGVVTKHKGVGTKYNLSGFKGYQIHADEATIGQIAADENVAWIEKDAKVHTALQYVQKDAPWGLGRISDTPTGATTYKYDSSSGTGVHVYVLDTGILTTHEQFGGRAVWGANFISGSADTDENGHGTHCAGTIGGNGFGVAKNVGLIAVKVLDADGEGLNSGTIAGIDWVVHNAASLGYSQKAVLSISLSGPASHAVNDAVASAVAAGITVVVAAGNDGWSAELSSPASALGAITVGAIDSTNTKPIWSNFGAYLDIFAPGVFVLSSWIGSDKAFNILSGTSMATPHVAGLAAYLIALEGLSTPAAVTARIKALAKVGLVKSPGDQSPNLLAYNGIGL